MKFLHVPPLSALVNCIAAREIGDVRYDARIEAYSLKDVGNDKKHAKELEEILKAEEGLHRERRTSFSYALADLGSSPSSSPTYNQSTPLRLQHHTGGTAGTPSSSLMDARTLYYVITCLNSSYPDYDFSLLRPHHFTCVPAERLKEQVIAPINSCLAELDREEASCPTLPTELDAMLRQAREEEGAGQEAGQGDSASTSAKKRSHSHTSDAGTAEGEGGKAGGSGKKRARSDSKHAPSPAMPPTAASYGSHFLSAFWRILSDCISTSDCEVYVLPVEMLGLSEGCLWSSAYLFLNRKLNRMLYLAALARPKHHAVSERLSATRLVRKRVAKGPVDAQRGSSTSYAATSSASLPHPSGGTSELVASEHDDGEEDVIDGSDEVDIIQYAAPRRSAADDEEGNEELLEPSAEADGYGEGEGEDTERSTPAQKKVKPASARQANPLSFSIASPAALVGRR